MISPVAQQLQVEHLLAVQQNKFASNLRQKHTSTIGVVLQTLDSYFTAKVISVVVEERMEV